MKLNLTRGRYFGLCIRKMHHIRCDAHRELTPDERKSVKKSTSKKARTAWRRDLKAELYGR